METELASQGFQGGGDDNSLTLKILLTDKKWKTYKMPYS
jgi:hypothetical protein